MSRVELVITVKGKHKDECVQTESKASSIGYCMYYWACPLPSPAWRRLSYNTARLFTSLVIRYTDLLLYMCFVTQYYHLF